jgi:hypothetical protein
MMKETSVAGVKTSAVLVTLENPLWFQMWKCMIAGSHTPPEISYQEVTSILTNTGTTLRPASKIIVVTTVVTTIKSSSTGLSN